ncbi:MAG: hypothetical protein M3Q91_05735, partial [Acidobacteriota bacterium]|nr:hypothetical protein [Acidobacteriota bacterium]
MFTGNKNKTVTLVVLAALAMMLGGGRPLAQQSSESDSAQDKSRARRTTDDQKVQPSPSPTPRLKDELPQDSDEVVRVETNLTSIFFTAADKNKRFISTLKKEDLRVLEDGQAQEIFTFQ